MVSYTDSEVKIFHPLCEAALKKALKITRLERDYEVLHHQYTGTLEMDFVIRNLHTKQYLCVIEVKRTPADVQSTRYQIQAQSYVQMNGPQNEKPFYIITNLEKLISFRYDPAKPRVHQQMLLPGIEQISDFKTDSESVLIDKASKVFARLIRQFQADSYQYLTTLEQFLNHMDRAALDERQWKSSMAMLMYEYIRGAFRAVKRPELKQDVHKFCGDVEQVCLEAGAVDFEGIFAYDAARYVPRLLLPSSIFKDLYEFGNANIAGDAIADTLYSRISEGNQHDGEVPTDPELASLAAVLARILNGPLEEGKKICDPAAGSGSLICASIEAFQAKPNQLIASDVHPRLVELLSLRLGLRFPNVVAKPNVSRVTTEDIVRLERKDFEEVDVVLLNPPFVAGIYCADRKRPFYERIKALTGKDAATKVGQMNLGAVFLEMVCHLVKTGTTIVCIFPKAHLTERGEEAVAFRKMLLELFGLQVIFDYPAEGLFDSVTEETCLFAGKVRKKPQEVLVYSSSMRVADLDLHALQNVAEEYSKVEFTTIFPGVEAKLFDRNELLHSVEGGWRMVCSEMLEAIEFVERHINQNPRMDLLPNTADDYRKGQVGVNGGSNLMFLEPDSRLYKKYAGKVCLQEGMRNAKCEEFQLYKGDSKFLNFNEIPSSSLADAIARDYTRWTGNADTGRQQKRNKTSEEWEKIAKKDAKVEFSENSVLIPTKTRRRGRVHLTRVPMHVSTNFVVFTYTQRVKAEMIASYMTTVFYQLECEVMSKNHAGVRKGEVSDVVLTHVPRTERLGASEISQIQAEIPHITFLDLNHPQISRMDEIWAGILFGAQAGQRLGEAGRLLRFLANKRNA